jgi:phosphodiesterase/alkaline phosphatase D-like protein
MGQVLEITRWVHWVHLNGLAPNTTYYFIAGYGDIVENYSVERKFRTIPEGTSQLHFVAGGDMGVIPVAEEIARVMATKEPQFALLGGDISYANSKKKLRM